MGRFLMNDMFWDEINSILDNKEDIRTKELWRKYWKERNKKDKEWADIWLYNQKMLWHNLLEEKELRRIDTHMEKRTSSLEINKIPITGHKTVDNTGIPIHKSFNNSTTLNKKKSK